MQLIEPGDIAEFGAILRRHHLAQSDFSLTAIDITDPKTDEVSGLEGELTVTRTSTGQTRQYLISDNTSWLDLFRMILPSGSFWGGRKAPGRDPAGAPRLFHFNSEV